MIGTLQQNHYPLKTSSKGGRAFALSPAVCDARRASVIIPYGLCVIVKCKAHSALGSPCQKSYPYINEFFFLSFQHNLGTFPSVHQTSKHLLNLLNSFFNIFNHSI